MINKPNKPDTRPKRATVQRAINGIKGHLERHPNDGQSVSHLAKLEAKLNTCRA